MSALGQMEDVVVEPGLFTRLRPFAGWFFVATLFAMIAVRVLRCF
jgi:hypothetical protein